MSHAPHLDLSRRERQIMLVLFERGASTANEVLDRLPDPPSYSAVRTMLRILEEKGHVRHVQDGPRYVYEAVQPREQASKNALTQVVRTFFDNAPEQAMAALLEMRPDALSDDALARLQDLIENARKEGR